MLGPLQLFYSAHTRRRYLIELGRFCFGTAATFESIRNIVLGEYYPKHTGRSLRISGDCIRRGPITRSKNSDRASRPSDLVVSHTRVPENTHESCCKLSKYQFSHSADDALNSHSAHISTPKCVTTTAAQYSLEMLDSKPTLLIPAQPTTSPSCTKG
jgi:hypothetical protein